MPSRSKARSYAAKVPGKSGSPMVVLAPGGKTLYSAGIAVGPPKGERVNKDWPDGRIYKFSLDSLADGGKEFATVEMPEKAKPPTGGWTADASRAAINGLAVDAKGNVYAADCANGKVHKFDPAGKLVGSADVPDAFQVVVNDKTGALYVLAAKERGAGRMLMKLNACEPGAKPVATLNIGNDDAGTPFLAGDFNADPPQLWIAIGTRIPKRPGEANDINPYGWAASLLRIKDSGDKLEQVADFADQAAFAIPGVDRMSADPQTDDLYINDGWYSVYRLEGVERVYPSLAPFSGWLRSDACVCRSPRFDLDAYGRLFIPNAVTYTVQVVDNVGNEIATFGQYGNYDNGNAAAEKPGGSKVPLGWPISVAATEQRLYVGDLLNRRVVRLKPTYRLEQSATLP